MVEFHEQGAFVSVDVEATRRMYTLIDHGETDDCECGWCRYFSKHRSEAYPQQFLELLISLGHKEQLQWKSILAGVFIELRKKRVVGDLFQYQPCIEVFAEHLPTKKKCESSIHIFIL